VKHKGNPQPTTQIEWVGWAFLILGPLGFFVAAFTGHVVLALVLVTPLGAYAQWSIWVNRRRLEGSASSFSTALTRESMTAAAD
jgi:hypothetical protein